MLDASLREHDYLIRVLLHRGAVANEDQRHSTPERAHRIAYHALVIGIESARRLVKDQ